MSVIYLDNAATEKVSKSAASEILKYSAELYFNPGGRGKASLAVMKDIDAARRGIADILNAPKGRLLFTSCATEANNLVLRSSVKRKNGKIIISAGEHASVYNTAKAISDKFDVKIIGLNKDGTVNEDALIKEIDGDAALVSIIHVNNETGVINDVNALAKKVKAKNKNCLFHSDGVQAFCKIEYSLAHEIDLYTVSAHKIGGMKGIGALYIKDGLNLNPIITGGKQENNLRAGTENVAGIMSFYAAAKERQISIKEAFDKAAALKNIFVKSFSALPDVNFNGMRQGGASLKSVSPYILSVSFKGVKAEVLAAMCEDNGVIAGLGSACSASYTDNRILSAMGHSQAFIEGSIRISFSHETTADECIRAADIICANVKALRK